MRARASGRKHGEIQERRIRHHLLPLELQRIVISEAMRASLEVRDFSGAAGAARLQVVGSQEISGHGGAVRRLAERSATTRRAERLQARDRISRPRRGAEAVLDIMLRQRRDETNQADALRELETLAVLWRGDAIEVRALQMMANLYRRRTPW
jgi:hypothetical protein